MTGQGAVGSRIDPGRLVRAWVLATAGPALISGLLLPARDSDPSAIALLALLALTLAVGKLGGRMPAVCAAALGALLVSWFVLIPSGALLDRRPVDLLALAGFLGLACWLIRTVEPATRAARTVVERASDTLAG